VYWRGRYQQTKSTHLPITAWLSTVLGVQFTIGHRVKLQLAGGVAAYLNTSEYMGGPLAEIGLSVYFGNLERNPTPSN
jgi:hypothetical protein